MERRGNGFHQVPVETSKGRKGETGTDSEKAGEKGCNQRGWAFGGFHLENGTDKAVPVDLYQELLSPSLTTQLIVLNLTLQTAVRHWGMERISTSRLKVGRIRLVRPKHKKAH